MKKTILPVMMMGMCAASAMAGVTGNAPNTDLNLMPYPQSVELHQGRIAITSDFKVYIQGYQSERITFTAQRLIDRLARQTGLPLLSPFASQASEATVIIEVKEAAKTPVQSLDADESYTLTAENGRIVLSSARPYGAIRGIETLLQLVETDRDGYFVPQVAISDAPRFPWRGVSYDTSRHFIPVAVIKRQLDAMASAKLNIFHWHLWDDQAIRIQLDSYPKLWQMTADGHYYSKDQIRDVVAYARQLGIRVIPEISLPGHASAVAHAYPSLMSGEEGQTYPHQRHWGVFEPLMDPTNPALYTFLGKVFDEVVALFPDEYVHIGGDEPDYSQWTNNAGIQDFIRSHQLDGNQGLQSYLNTKVETLLAERGKKVMGWDEIWHKDLPKSVVIQSWRGHDSIGRAAQEGYQGILSTGYYLDQPQPTSYHYRNDPMPPGIQVDDTLHPGETFVTYEWAKPRTKGGPRKGLLTIIEGKDGTVRAFTDYNGKSRAKVEVLDYVPGTRFRGHFDNFMSYTEFNLRFADTQLAEGSYQLIGNVRWPTTGTLVAGTAIKGSEIPAPTGGYPAELNAREQQRILGGELTVWAENLDGMTVENRIWPRSYAIAERLWSDAALTDEASMYRRMAVLDDWAELSVGLQHHVNARLMLQRLANGQGLSKAHGQAQGTAAMQIPGTLQAVTALQTLARYTEPAQYYARNWEKWIQTTPSGQLYNQHERLNRFVDALPVESLTVYVMNALVKHYQAERQPETLVALRAHFELAAQAAEQAKTIFAENTASVATVPLADATTDVAEIAGHLITALEQGQALSQADSDAYRQRLSQAAAIYDEAIVATVKPAESLLVLVEQMQPST